MTGVVQLNLASSICRHRNYFSEQQCPRVDEPGYRYTGTCSQGPTCNITLDFNKGGNATGILCTGSIEL